MTFKDLVTKLQIDTKALSAKYNIPMRTIYRWLDGSRRPPDYVLLLIYDNYLLEGLTHGITSEAGEELAGRMGRDIEGIQEVSKKS